MQSFRYNLILLIKRVRLSMNIDVNIDACKQGEQEALGDLYKAYSNKLRGICQHYVKDESTAEDILHDAFIIIFTSIKTLKDNSKLEGWMIKHWKGQHFPFLFRRNRVSRNRQRGDKTHRYRTLTIGH